MPAGWIMIDMGLVEATGINTVQVLAVSDTTAQSITTTWNVGWELYPSPTTPPDLPYVFNPIATQSPTFTLPITISTAQVRILGAKYGAVRNRPA